MCTLCPMIKILNLQNKKRDCVHVLWYVFIVDHLQDFIERQFTAGNSFRIGPLHTFSNTYRVKAQRSLGPQNPMYVRAFSVGVNLAACHKYNYRGKSELDSFDLSHPEHPKTRLHCRRVESSAETQSQNQACVRRINDPVIPESGTQKQICWIDRSSPLVSLSICLLTVSNRKRGCTSPGAGEVRTTFLFKAPHYWFLHCSFLLRCELSTGQRNWGFEKVCAI